MDTGLLKMRIFVKNSDNICKTHGYGYKSIHSNAQNFMRTT